MHTEVEASFQIPLDNEGKELTGEYISERLEHSERELRQILKFIKDFDQVYPNPEDAPSEDQLKRQIATKDRIKVYEEIKEWTGHSNTEKWRRYSGQVLGVFKEEREKEINKWEMELEHAHQVSFEGMSAEQVDQIAFETTILEKNLATGKEEYKKLLHFHNCAMTTESDKLHLHSQPGTLFPETKNTISNTTSSMPSVIPKTNRFFNRMEATPQMGAARGFKPKVLTHNEDSYFHTPMKTYTSSHRRGNFRGAGRGKKSYSTGRISEATGQQLEDKFRSFQISEREDNVKTRETPRQVHHNRGNRNAGHHRYPADQYENVTQQRSPISPVNTPQQDPGVGPQITAVSSIPAQQTYQLSPPPQVSTQTYQIPHIPQNTAPYSNPLAHQITPGSQLHQHQTQVNYTPQMGAAYSGYPNNNMYGNVQLNGTTSGSYQPPLNNMNYGSYQAGPNMYMQPNSAFVPMSGGQVPLNIMVKPSFKSRYAPYRGRSNNELNIYLAALVDHVIAHLGPASAVGHYSIIAEILSNVGEVLTPYCKTIDPTNMTYQEFVATIKDNYTIVVPKEKINDLDQFIYAEREKNESLAEFAAKLKTLAKKAYPYKTENEINEEKIIYKRFVTCMPEPIRIYIDRAINNARVSGCNYIKNWASLKIMIQNVTRNMGEEKVTRILRGEGLDSEKVKKDIHASGEKRPFFPYKTKNVVAKLEEDGTMTILRDFEEKENIIPTENVQPSHTILLSQNQPPSSAQVSHDQMTHSSSQSQFHSSQSQFQPQSQFQYSQSQFQPHSQIQSSHSQFQPHSQIQPSHSPFQSSQSQFQPAQSQLFSQHQHTNDMNRQTNTPYDQQENVKFINSNLISRDPPTSNNNMAELNFINYQTPLAFDYNNETQYPPLPYNSNNYNLTGQLQNNKPITHLNENLTNLSPAQKQAIIKQSIFNQQERDRLTKTTRGYKTCTVCGAFAKDHSTEKCPWLLKACVFCKEFGHSRLMCRKEAQIYCNPNALPFNFNQNLSNTLGNFQKKWLDQPKIFDQYNIKSALADLLTIVNNFSNVIEPSHKINNTHTPNYTTAGQNTKKDNSLYCPKAGGDFQKNPEKPRFKSSLKKIAPPISKLEKSMMNPYSVLNDEVNEESYDSEGVSEESDLKTPRFSRKSEKRKKIKVGKSDIKAVSPNEIGNKKVKLVSTSVGNTPVISNESPHEEIANNFSSFAGFDKNSISNKKTEEVTIENMVDRPEVFECFITIGEESTIALIDSGAGHSSLRMDWVQTHNLPFVKNEDPDLKSFGLAGQVTIIGKSLYSPQIHDLKFPEMKFRVNEYRPLDYPVVLGRDFLESNQVVIDPLRSSLFKVFADGAYWCIFSDTRAKTCRRIVNKMPIYCKEKDPKGQTVTLSLSGSGIQLIPNLHCACNLKKNKELQELNNLILVKNESLGHLELIPEFVTLVDDPFCINLKIQNREGKLNNVRPGYKIGTACSIICTKLDSERIQHIYDLEMKHEEQECIGVSAKLDSRSPPSCELNQYDEPEQIRMDSTWNKEQMGEQMDIEEGDKEFHGILQDLLWKNQNLFYPPDYTLESELTPMDIPINSEMPICISQPKQSNQVNDLIEKKCHELVDKGILEPSDSQYNLPIYAVRNPKGEVRLILDFRNINKKIIEYEDPLEDITSFIKSTSDTTEVFSTLTLFDDFNQLTIDPKSRDYVSFSTALRKYRFRRAIKECHYTPIAFHLALKHALGDIITAQQVNNHSSKMVIHENAIIIMSSSKSSHIHFVNQILERLTQLKLKLSLTKSKFGKPQLNFRGQIISQQGFQKDPKYIDQFLLLKKPEYVGDLIKFFEYLKWVEKFMPEYQLLIKEFESILKETKRKQSSRIIWTTSMEDSYEEIKKLVAADIAISLPESGPESQDITIYSDSSTRGCGGLATQIQKGEQRILGIYSFRYGPHQRCYSVTDLELTSIKLCLKHFKPLISGRKVNVLCDHSCLQYLSTLRLTSDRLLRTIEEISAYNCTITYYPGLSNMLADSLSRLDMKLRSKKEDYNPKHEFGYLPNYVHICKRPPGGGDSMICALSWKLDELMRTENYKDLRNVLVNEILDNPNLYGFSLTEKTQKFWEKYRIRGEICPEIFLQAFANKYNIIVQVFFGEEFPIHYLPCHKDTEFPAICMMQCVSGIHYNLLRRTENTMPEFFLDPKFVRHLSPLIPITVRCESSNLEEVSLSNKNTREEEPEKLDIRRITIDCDHCESKGCSNIKFPGSFNNFCLNFDTSIPYSILSHQVFKEIATDKNNHKIGSINLTAQIGNQVPQIIDADIVELQFSIGNEKKFSGRFAIVPEIYMNQCVVMGMEVMSQNSLSLDFSRSLVFSQKKELTALSNRTNEGENKFESRYKWKLYNKITETVCINHLLTEITDKKEDILDKEKDNTPMKRTPNLRDKLEEPLNMDQIKDNFSSFRPYQLDTVEFIRRREELRLINNDYKLNFPNSQAFKDDHFSRNPETYVIQCQDSEGYYDCNNISVKDTEITDVKWLIKNNIYKWPRSLSHFWNVKRNLILIRDNRLLGYKEEGIENIKMIFPKNWIINYIIQYHKLRNGHLSANKIYHEINDVIYYPNLLKLIREITSTCPFCQLHKTSFVPSNPSAPVYKINPESAFHTIQLDLNVQDRDPKTGMKYILACVDLTSKWLICTPVRTKTGKAITEAFRDKILPKLFALPSVVSSDGGREFDNREFKELLDSFGIKHRIGVANFHASKGGIERVNKTLRSLLKIKMENETKNNWTQHLGSAIFDYNHLYHSVIKTSPQKFLLQGVHYNNPNPVIDIKEENTWKKAAPGFQIYSANSRVLKQRVHGETQTCEEKRQPSWSGPYRIVSIGPHPLTYVLKHEGIISNRKKLVLAHHSQLCLIKYPSDEVVKNNPNYRQMWKNYPGWMDPTKIDPSIGIAKDHKIYQDLMHQNTVKSLPLTKEEREELENDEDNLFNTVHISNIPIYKQHTNEQGEVYLEAENRVANDMYNQIFNKRNKVNKLYSPILAPYVPPNKTDRQVPISNPFSLSTISIPHSNKSSPFSLSPTSIPHSNKPSPFSLSSATTPYNTLAPFSQSFPSTPMMNETGDSENALNTYPYIDLDESNNNNYVVQNKQNFSTPYRKSVLERHNLPKMESHAEEVEIVLNQSTSSDHTPGWERKDSDVTPVVSEPDKLLEEFHNFSSYDKLQESIPIINAPTHHYNLRSRGKVDINMSDYPTK